MLNVLLFCRHSGKRGIREAGIGGPGAGEHLDLALCSNCCCACAPCLHLHQPQPRVTVVTYLAVGREGSEGVKESRCHHGGLPVPQPLYTSVSGHLSFPEGRE